MSINNTKRFAKVSLIRGIFLLVISVPLIAVAFLKLIYFVPNTEGQLLRSALEGTRSLVVELHNNFELIKYLWPISPTPNLNQVFTQGNLIAIILFIGVLWGFASIRACTQSFKDLSEAKLNAKKRDLENEYRKK